MLEDLILLLGALVGAAGINLSYEIKLIPMVVVCTLLFAACVFWIGVRAGRRERE